MLEAFDAERDAVRAGVTFADVHAAGARVLARAGYPCGSSGLARNVTHHWGGRVESGNLRPYNERRLEPGIVLSVEPCAFVAGVGAPRHCDMMLVTRGGHEIWSSVDDGLIRIAA
jgi:Xaa-Pro aminopeptidase